MMMMMMTIMMMMMTTTTYLIMMVALMMMTAMRMRLIDNNCVGVDSINGEGMIETFHLFIIGTCRYNRGMFL